MTTAGPGFTGAGASASAATPRPKGSRPLNVPPLGGPAASRAWTEFQARVRDDQATVDRLDGDLTNAADAVDLEGVRKAAVAILDFVDGERDWLVAHAPGDCFAAAHESAMAMLDAYGSAADRFVDWSTTGGGLGGLSALGRAANAADTAKAALATFTSVMGGTTCQD